MDREEPKDAAGPAGKKAYEPPRILSRESLEAVAVHCSPPGKANPGLCPSGPISS